MRLLTASHSERPAILQAGAVHVRISRGHPRGTPALPVVRELMPSRELLDQAGTLDPDEWSTRYLAGLDEQVDAIDERLRELAAEREPSARALLLRARRARPAVPPTRLRTLVRAAPARPCPSCAMCADPTRAQAATHAPRPGLLTHRRDVAPPLLSLSLPERHTLAQRARTE